MLLENPGQGGSLNHLGVEVADTEAVEAEQARLAGAGLARGRGAVIPPVATPGRTSSGSRARPTARRWEIYTVLDDSPTFWGQEGSQRWEAAAAELDDARDTAAAARDAGPATVLRHESR